MKNYSYNHKREGFLSEDNNECEILFVLKEPNIDGEADDNTFWFRDIVMPVKGKGVKHGERYYNYLTKMAQAFDIPLEQCGYMNLYPLNGEGSPSAEYLEFLKDMEMRTESAKMRMECIQALKPKMIVACRQVYNAIAEYYSPVIGADECLEYENRKYPFKSCKIKITDQEIPVFAFYHPSYPFDLADHKITLQPSPPSKKN